MLDNVNLIALLSCGTSITVLYHIDLHNNYDTRFTFLIRNTLRNVNFYYHLVYLVLGIVFYILFVNGIPILGENFDLNVFIKKYTGDKTPDNLVSIVLGFGIAWGSRITISSKTIPFISTSLETAINSKMKLNSRLRLDQSDNMRQISESIVEGRTITTNEIIEKLKKYYEDIIEPKADSAERIVHINMMDSISETTLEVDAIKKMLSVYSKRELQSILR